MLINNSTDKESTEDEKSSSITSPTKKSSSFFSKLFYTTKSVQPNPSPSTPTFEPSVEKRKSQQYFQNTLNELEEEMNNGNIQMSGYVYLPNLQNDVQCKEIFAYFQQLQFSNTNSIPSIYCSQTNNIETISQYMSPSSSSTSSASSIENIFIPQKESNLFDSLRFGNPIEQYWKMYWVELKKDQTLCVYEEKNQIRPKLSIQLSQHTFYLQPCKELYPLLHSFSIIFQQTGSTSLQYNSLITLLYFVRTKTYHDMQLWMHQLKQLSRTEMDNMRLMQMEAKILENEKQRSNMQQRMSNSSNDTRNYRLKYYNQLKVNAHVRPFSSKHTRIPSNSTNTATATNTTLTTSSSSSSLVSLEEDEK